MSQTKTYSGGCHCGAVRFEAELDLDEPAGECNCTLCTKRNATTMIVKPDAYRVVAGDDSVTEYSWRPDGIRFAFCRRCGVALHSRGDIPALGGKYASVNINTLDGIDPATQKVVHWDGRHDNWQAGPRDRRWPVSA